MLSWDKHQFWASNDDPFCGSETTSTFSHPSPTVPLQSKAGRIWMHMRKNWLFPRAAWVWGMWGNGSGGQCESQQGQNPIESTWLSCVSLTLSDETGDQSPSAKEPCAATSSQYRKSSARRATIIALNILRHWNVRARSLWDKIHQRLPWQFYR